MMNRILTQILAAMMVLNLAACGQPTINNNTPENAEAAVEEIDTEEAADMAAAILPGGWQKADSLVYINEDAEGNVSLNDIIALNAAEAAEE